MSLVHKPFRGIGIENSGDFRNFGDVRLTIEIGFLGVKSGSQIDTGDFAELLIENNRVFFGVDGMVVCNEHIMFSAGGNSFVAEPDSRVNGAEVVSEVRRAGRFDTGQNGFIFQHIFILTKVFV